jgi:hypothetical protein
MKSMFKPLIITAINLFFAVGVIHAKTFNACNPNWFIQPDSLTKAKRNEIIQQLDSILKIDQKYRPIIRSVRKEFGNESDTIKKLWKVIAYNDSMSLIKVTDILDHYGWLGPEAIGNDGNRALFFVIQHSNKTTMEKYLPMMKEAVTKGNADPDLLALLIDRTELLNDRPQIYGSQVQMIDGKYVLYKTIDIKNVNSRRAEVGLGPLEEYLKEMKVDFKMPDN